MSAETPPLTGEERLFLSSRVNMLCEVEVADFDPETQLQDAQRIIELLDPRIKDWKFKLEGTYHGEPDSHSVTGSTNQGDFSTSFESDGTKHISIGGGDEFRTGMYVVVKHPTKKSNHLIFEHFWDRGENNSAFGVYPSQTDISYDKGSLRIDYIERIIHRPSIWGPFALVNGGHFVMWPQKRMYSRIAGLSVRF